MLRTPAVAGQFYPDNAQALKNQIESFIDKKTVKKEVIGCILPHAGYIYSGFVAAAVVSKIILKENFILLGPNHTGIGKAFSIMTEGNWLTPLGEVQINSKLAKSVLKNSKYLKEDSSAHRYEHSLEVELPFLQYFRKDFKIVPIVISSDDETIYKEIGKEIAKELKELSKDTVIIASSDMTHYEPVEIARKKDHHAIQAILELDENKLWQTIKKLNISMCGYAPIIVMLSAAKELGAKKGELIKYQTSGETSGDYSAVVGYAGIIIS